MIDRIAEIRGKVLTQNRALRLAEFAMAPITLAYTLIGCSLPSGYTRFNEEEYKYSITIDVMSNKGGVGYLYLFSNEEPLLTQDGNRTTLRAKSVVCPTSIAGKNSFDPHVLQGVGCKPGVYDYTTSTDKIIVVTTSR